MNEAHMTSGLSQSPGPHRGRPVGEAWPVPSAQHDGSGSAERTI
jgi:hypothetical protein